MPSPTGDTNLNPKVFLWPIGYLVVLVLLALLYGANYSSLPSYIREPLGAMPLSVVWFGALGGVMISLHGIFNREGSSSWHAFSGAMGAVFGVVSYLALILIIKASTNTSAIVFNTITFDLIAFIAGFGQKQFQVVLKKLSGLLFSQAD